MTPSLRSVVSFVPAALCVVCGPSAFAGPGAPEAGFQESAFHARAAPGGSPELEPRGGDGLSPAGARGEATELRVAWNGAVVDGERSGLEARSEAAQRLARGAWAALQRARFALAGELAREALRIHPQEEMAIEVIEQLEAEQGAVLSQRDAERAERAGSLPQAVQAARRALEQRGTPEREALLQRLQTRAFTELEAAAERAARAGDFDRAIELYDSSSEIGVAPEDYSETLLDLHFGLELQIAERAERECNYWDAAQHLADAQAYRSPQGFPEQVARILKGIAQRCPGAGSAIR